MFNKTTHNSIKSRYLCPKLRSKMADLQDNPAMPALSKEDRIQLAVEAVRSGSIASVKAAVRTFDVPRTTLQRRLLGSQSVQISKQPFQRLSVKKEEAIVGAAY